MKVAILTFSLANNRGAMMQCYALYSKLEELGHDPTIVSIALPSPKHSWRGKITSVIEKYLFDSFRKKHFRNTTKIYKSAEELRKDPPVADAYIVGSDQVWNSKLISRFGCEAFFLDFALPEKKRIAYAVSLGEDKWENPDKKILDLIKNFDTISVREDDSVSILKQNLKVDNVKVVLDPVFLFNNYENLLCKDHFNNGNILIMSLFKNPLFLEISEEISRRFDCKVEQIGYRKSKKSHIIHPFVGVIKWLKMIYGARIIITNSFHCMAMSIIFGKDFIVVPPYPGREKRMTSMLSKLSLSNRYVKDLNDFESRIDELMVSIDYEPVHKKLDQLRIDAVNYLKNALS